MPRKPASRGQTRKSAGTIPIKTIDAWSFSRLTTYEQCPAKAKYQIIDKLPIKPNAAMDRGAKIHRQAENYVKGKLRELPEDLQLFDEEFMQLREMFVKKSEHKVMPEQKWAFTRDWVPTEYFARDTFLRVVVDCAVLNEKEGRLTVIDYKTGKIRDGYDQQLRLYAAAGFALYPFVEQVCTELWYIDQGEIKGGPEDDEITGVYVKDEHDDLVKEWDKRIKPMLVDKQFAPKPNNLCKWCDYSKANGGPCEY